MENKKIGTRLLSLSSGIAGEKVFIHRYLIGRKRLIDLGCEIIESKNSLLGTKILSNNPELRAADYIDALYDEKTNLMVSNIGGDDSYKLWPFIKKIDKKLITGEKKFLGFSDSTSIHLMNRKLGISSYYGPSVLAGFAENVKLFDETIEYFNFWFKSDEKVKEIVSSKYWTSEFLEWKEERNNKIERHKQIENKGFLWFNFNQDVEGYLIGGCLESMNNNVNSEYWPTPNEWKNSVIFLETSELREEPHLFEKRIQQMNAALQHCKAIIFGKPEDEKYFFEYLEILKKIGKPLIYNMNFGHTCPSIILKYDSKIVIKYKEKRVFIYK